MAAPAIATVKDAVRATDIEGARTLARKALELADGGAVRELLTATA
jgi:hypothetical protein